MYINVSANMSRFQKTFTPYGTPLHMRPTPDNGIDLIIDAEGPTGEYSFVNENEPGFNDVEFVMACDMPDGTTVLLVKHIE